MFVYKLEDKYLIYATTVAHTGFREFVSWTDNLNLASVFTWEDAKLRRLAARVDAKRVEVEEHRTVTEIQT